jgi:glycosyltransferase involved in cell wall biosynthesis
VLVPNEAAGMLLESRVAEAVGKIDVVPRAAVRLPTNGTDLRRSLGIPRHRFLIFLPGGLRPIKGQHRAMSMVSVVRSAGADVEMILAGPDQDPAYAAEVRALCQQQTGVRVLPPLAHDRMGAAYIDADVVLNTSFSEGAAPTILEAGILGRPVIAADVAGNRELIRHNETGLLFANEGDMAKQVLALYRNRSAAGALGVRIREDFQRRFSSDREISALLSAYAAA